MFCALARVGLHACVVLRGGRGGAVSAGTGARGRICGGGGRGGAKAPPTLPGPDLPTRAPHCPCPRVRPGRVRAPRFQGPR